MVAFVVIATIVGFSEAVFVPFVVGAAIIMFVLLVVITRPPGQAPFPAQTMQILRLVMSLGAGMVGGGLTGAITIQEAIPGVAVEAAGGLAVFVLVFWSLRAWGR